MKGRKCNQSNELKKKLTVTPFIPGAPIPIHYCLYKINDNFMYIPKHFSKEGELIENKVNFCNININGNPRDYQKDVIDIIYKRAHLKRILYSMFIHWLGENICLSLYCITIGCENYNSCK